MSVTPNIVRPVWNQKQISNMGSFGYIEVPNDFADYDEVWAHILVHDVQGAPTSNLLYLKWQIGHPQAGGSYHDVSPEWHDLEYEHNGHLLHSGLDWPVKPVRGASGTSTFSPPLEYVRGLRLGTGRVRLAYQALLSGGTSPYYTVSLSLMARAATPDIKPTPQPKLIGASSLIDYMRDVWGYSIRDTGGADYKVRLQDGSGGTNLLTVQMGANESRIQMFDRPIRFESGVYAAVNGTGEIVLYTTDNMRQTP